MKPQNLINNDFIWLESWKNYNRKNPATIWINLSSSDFLFLVWLLLLTSRKLKAAGWRRRFRWISAVLDRGLHPADVDSFSDQQLFGVTHGWWRRLGRAGKNPGVVDVEEVEEAGARVNHGQAGVVGGQNPVGSVRSD